MTCSSAPTRIIMHLDLDCFYAQVEMLRLNVARETPFVVSQWGGLIAVNYPARDFGIKRMDNLHDALKRCPTLQYGHVATYAAGEKEYKYHGSAVTKNQHKVSLEPYRCASERIFRTLESFHGVIVEKGGCDEAFCDVTEACLHLVESGAVLISPLDVDELQHMTELWDRRAAVESPPDLTQWSAEGPIVQRVEVPSRKQVDCLGARIGDWSSQEDQVENMYRAAVALTSIIRLSLLQRLGFQCSAGVAPNCMLCKCLSASHKPNKQAVLLPSGLEEFLTRLPFAKLRGFGGKLGRQLAVTFDATFCRELWGVSLERLQEALKDKDQAKYVFDRVRGIDGTKVSARSVPKSLLAQKAFAPATTELDKIKKWIEVLSHELHQRMNEFHQKFGAEVKTFNVKLDGRGLQSNGAILNRSCPMPWPPSETLMTNIAVELTRSALKQTGEMVNCVMLSATGISVLGGLSGTSASISTTVAAAPFNLKRSALNQTTLNQFSSAQVSGAKRTERSDGEVILLEPLLKRKVVIDLTTDEK